MMEINDSISDYIEWFGIFEHFITDIFVYEILQINMIFYM